jgi:choline dehydrogenase-like flavoprotein
MDISYVPAAIRAGARVYTSVRAEQVLHQGRRVTGVRGRVVAPFSGTPGPTLTLDARAVVLAAGCMATPLLLLASELANGSGQVGRNLQFHPGVAVMGVFPDRVDPQFGATQGMQSLHFLREGFKLETLWAPPAVLAVRLPGAGLALKERLAEIPYASIVDAIASCHRSLGSVRPRRRGSLDPVLHWRLDPEDLPVLGRALAVIVDVLFAAGARKVLPGVHGLPDEMGLADAALLRDRSYRATDFVMAANDAFCSTRMHGAAAQGVVDESGRCHELDNLYVADTGVFPRCTSVNPMLTGMALAHRTASALHTRL